MNFDLSFRLETQVMTMNTKSLVNYANLTVLKSSIVVFNQISVLTRTNNGC